MKFPWKRLIRFVGTDGEVHYGEPEVNSAEELHEQLKAGNLEAKCLNGGIFDDTATLEGKTTKVEKLLGPLAEHDVPLVKGIGLNYAAHIKEAGRTPPEYPMFFIKASSSIADWNESIPIPKLAQDDQCDYEGEMCFVIGKPGKNIPKSQALDYIAAYVNGNDVSARKWQSRQPWAGPMPQFNFSKGFDKYAPLGPMLVSSEMLGTANDLSLETKVNGELRQSSNTSDLLFDVPTLVEFLSQGTTLQKGTVVMTGTPSGVGLGFDPPKWLKDGDVVEITVGQLGTLRNEIKFE